MYCINCGVELADSEKSCPLCGLAVYHPELTAPDTDARTFPKYVKNTDKVSRKGRMFVVTMLFLIPLLLVTVCDISINGRMSWSGYAVGGLLLGYIIVILPFWFKRPNPVIFVPVSFFAVAMYVLYIDLVNRGGWYLSFALPVIGSIGAVITTVVTLLRYVRRGNLYVYGGACLAGGIIMVMMELLINHTFGRAMRLIWSYYPLIVFTVIGVLLLVVAICRPIRESLHKKFFI